MQFLGGPNPDRLWVSRLEELNNQAKCLNADGVLTGAMCGNLSLPMEMGKPADPKTGPPANPTLTGTPNFAQSVLGEAKWKYAATGDMWRYLLGNKPASMSVADYMKQFGFVTPQGKIVGYGGETFSYDYPAKPKGPIAPYLHQADIAFKDFRYYTSMSGSGLNPHNAIGFSFVDTNLAGSVDTPDDILKVLQPTNYTCTTTACTAAADTEVYKAFDVKSGAATSKYSDPKWYSPMRGQYFRSDKFFFYAIPSFFKLRADGGGSVLPGSGLPVLQKKLSSAAPGSYASASNNYTAPNQALQWGTVDTGDFACDTKGFFHQINAVCGDLLTALVEERAPKLNLRRGPVTQVPEDSFQPSP